MCSRCVAEMVRSDSSASRISSQTYDGAAAEGAFPSDSETCAGIVSKLKGRGIGGMSPPHGGASSSSSSLPPTRNEPPPQPPQPQQTQQQAQTLQQPPHQQQQTVQTPQPPLAQPPQPQPQQLPAAAEAAAAAGAMAAGATAALPMPLLGAPLFPAPIALDATAAVAQLEAGVELEVPEVDPTPLQVEMLPEGMPGLGAPPSCP
mmetsp:Transcript_11482/g.38259  ORF Transcript_11482/g.38259 Transcript_11482/m.38259 type:complete len:204 (+) Transcript_11482:34-645(+)